MIVAVLFAEVKTDELIIPGSLLVGMPEAVWYTSRMTGLFLAEGEKEQAAETG